MTDNTTHPIHIIRAAVYHFRAPLEVPYRTTFGVMTHRQAVVITLDAADGTMGTAESWINFPLWAPLERMAAFEEGFFPGIVGKDIGDISAFVRSLWNGRYRAALQSATLGPAMQALAAVEAALLDIDAKRRGVGVGWLFSDHPAREIPTYGSGINPPFLEDAIREARDMGIDTFKLKLGYGDAEDRANIRSLKRLLGEGGKVAVDVNRSWPFDRTVEWMPYLRDEDIVWLEEPLSPEDQHRYPELKERALVPISAGENFLVPPGADFTREGGGGLSLNESGLALDMVQPAVVKNCCFSDAVRLGKLVEERGSRLCPHFLGSAPGMAATAHLASLSRATYLEWDINPNPLRTSLMAEPFDIRDGVFHMSGEPGMGWTLREDLPSSWIVRTITVKAGE